MDPNQKATPQDHNLRAKVTNKPFYFLKKIFQPTLETLAVLGALGFGLGLKSVLADDLAIPTLLGILAFYLIFSGLVTMLVKDLRRRSFVLFLEIAVLLLPFYFKPLNSLIAIAILLFVFFSWGISKARYEISNSMEIKFWKTMQPYFGKFITGLTFMVVILYLPKWDANNTFFSKKGFDMSFNSVSGLVSRLYPEIQITPTSTVETLAESVVLSQVQGNSAFKDLPQDAQRAYVKQATGEFLDNIRKNLGENINNKDTVSATFYKTIINKLTNWKGRFDGGFMLGWAVIMFFLIRSLGFIVSGFGLLVGYLIYESLLMSKLIKIGEVNIIAQTLEFAE